MDVACIDDNDSELFSSLGERLHAAFVSTLGDKLPAYTNRPFAPNLGDKLPTFTNRQSPVDADCEVERTQVRRSRWDDLDAHRQSPVKHVRKSSVTSSGSIITLPIASDHEDEPIQVACGKLAELDAFGVKEVRKPSNTLPIVSDRRTQVERSKPDELEGDSGTAPVKRLQPTKQQERNKEAIRLFKDKILRQREESQRAPSENPDSHRPSIWSQRPVNTSLARQVAAAKETPDFRQPSVLRRSGSLSPPPPTISSKRSFANKTKYAAK